MATLNIVIPPNFSQQLNQFMVNVQRMQQFTQKFVYTSQNVVPVQNLYLAHRSVTSRMSRLLLTVRQLNTRLQGVISRLMNSFGALGQTFVRGLAAAAEILGPIISVMFSVGSFIVTKAFSWGTFLARWLWDKFVGLGESLLQDYLLASGSFSTIGGLRAFRIATGMLPDDPGMLPAMIQARGNVTSMQLIALRTLNIKEAYDNADMMMQATIAAARWMKRQSRGLQLRLAGVFGISSLISPQRLVALENMTNEEIDIMERMYEDYKPLLKVSDKATLGWRNFVLQVKATGVQIATIIAKELANPASPFVQAFTELSKSISHLFKTIMQSPVTKELIRRLGKYIDEFADWLKKPETVGVVSKFIDDLKSITRDMLEAISILKQIIEDWGGYKPTPAPAVSPPVHGRRALGQRIGIDRPYEVYRRPPTTPGVPQPKYPGRARFHERIAMPTQRGKVQRDVAEPGPMPAPTPGGPAPERIGVTKGGTVNETDLYNTYVEYFKHSKLNGFVPKDGARWGIINGTPEEYARLAIATSKQESSLNPTINSNGLNQMSAQDLRRYGVGGNPLNPNNQAQGLVNQWEKHIIQDNVFSQPGAGPRGGHGGAGRFFESVQIKPGGRAQMERYLPRGAQGTPVSGTPQAVGPGGMLAATGQAPAAFIMHHTGGRGTAEGVISTLRQRGLGVEYVMERDGTIRQIGGPGASHMMTGWGPLGSGLSNRNTVGMEVIAKDDNDVTPAQVEAAKRFIRENYPNTPVFGHGEVNPGHKEAREGMTIVDAIRGERARGSVSGPAITVTPSGKSPTTGGWPTQGTEPWRSYSVDKAAVDNRSDSDVVAPKTSSDNDEDGPVSADPISFRQVDSPYSQEEKDKMYDEIYKKTLTEGLPEARWRDQFRRVVPPPRYPVDAPWHRYLPSDPGAKALREFKAPEGTRNNIPNLAKRGRFGRGDFDPKMTDPRNPAFGTDEYPLQELSYKNKEGEEVRFVAPERKKDESRIAPDEPPSDEELQ